MSKIKGLFVEELLKNNLGLEVLTDTGWSQFDGILLKGNKQTVTVTTQNLSIQCTADHKFYTTEYKRVEADQLYTGTEIICHNSIEKVVSVKLSDTTLVYDLLNVTNNNRFFANDILVSNCEFLIWDETLINPGHLLEMQGIEPIERQGQVRWYKRPDPKFTYMAALDPSLGTGGDPAAIQIFELPSFTQVGEWQHNRTPIQQQVRILSEILKYLAETVSITSIYYSVENNTLGEAALISISEIGEENLKGIFLSEPKSMGNSSRYRKGFNTTNKSKISACSKLKNLIETKRMSIFSKNLISELKTFVSTGASFAAKQGETDDLVMSLVLIVRMAQMLQSYDPLLDITMRDSLDDMILPMPFIMS